MVQLAGKPILEHQISLLGNYGFSEILILTGYRGDVIKNYFGTGGKWNVTITYYEDPKPLGTAGSVKLLERILTEPFLLTYGDTMFDLDMKRLVDAHTRNNCMATLVVHPNDHPHDSDLVEIDEENRITDFYSKPHIVGTYRRNLVNAALYVLNPEILKYIKADEFSDFGKDVFPEVVSQNRSLVAYNTREYIKDIGTIERLYEVEQDYFSGKIQRLNLRNSQKAIFMDRDGVINVEAEPINSPEQLILLPGVEEAIRIINQSDYLGIVVTNQPSIAKGFATEDQIQTVHNYLEGLLGENKSFLDRIYYCPHHPEKGHDGEREEYKIVCNCRKPATGMIDMASIEMNIDLSESFIIGDRTVDIMTGVNSKMHTVLIRQGYAGWDNKYSCKPDFIFEDLLEATQFIIHDYEKIVDLVQRNLIKPKAKQGSNLIIAIGGLSRSGKSTLASIIRKFYEGIGKQVKVVELDNWLLHASEQVSPFNARKYYQYENIENSLKALFAGEQIIFNKYDTQTHDVKKNALSMELNPDDIVLLDGVIALDHGFIRKRADQLICTQLSEPVRKKRFFEKYGNSGLPDYEIGELYKNMLKNIKPIINRSRDFAHFTIDMEPSR